MSGRAFLLLFIYLSIHFVLIFPLFVSVHSAGGVSAVAASKEKVIHLDDGNFVETVADGETLVDFFAPWCPHCVALKPIYYELADILSIQRPQLKIAMLDCILNPQTAKEQGIRAFPTIELIRNGRLVAQYNPGAGEQVNVESLLQFINKNSQTPSNNNKVNSNRNKNSPQQSSSSVSPDSSGTDNPPSSSSSSSTKKTSHQTNFEFNEMFSDFFSLRNPEIIKQIFLDILAAPTSIFENHPFFVLGCFYLFGLLNGLFIGIIYALRERRNAGD